MCVYSAETTHVCADMHVNWLPLQSVVLAQRENRLSVRRGLFPVKPGCVLPESLGSCAAALPSGCSVWENSSAANVCQRVLSALRKNI